MNAKRAAAIVVVGGALAVWLASAASSGNRDRADPLVVTRHAIDARAEVLSAEIAKLHEHLRPTAVRRQPGRNLFSYAARQARPDPAPAAASRPALIEAPPAAAAPPPLKLVGMAEDRSADGAVVRTAILSGSGQLLLVKEGDNATPRYRVARISADVVELSDLIEGTALRLALK
jgi:hypothetical protein